MRRKVTDVTGGGGCLVRKWNVGPGFQSHCSRLLGLRAGGSPLRKGRQHSAPGGRNVTFRRPCCTYEILCACLSPPTLCAAPPDAHASDISLSRGSAQDFCVNRKAFHKQPIKIQSTNLWAFKAMTENEPHTGAC